MEYIKDKPGGSFADDARRMEHDILGPGPALWEMNARVLETIVQYIEPIGSEFETKNLYMWLRDIFTYSTSTALLGSRTPLKDNPELLKAFW